MIDSEDDDPFTGQTSIVCSLCKSKSAITDLESAEIICSRCGMVISDKIEPRQECLLWKNRKSTGMPTSLARHDMGLYTVIERTNKDFSGHKIAPYMYSKDMGF